MAAMFGWLSEARICASRSEAGEALGVLGEGRRQDLERHLAPEPRVPRAVHLAHPARAESHPDLVRAEPHAGRHLHRTRRILGAVLPGITIPVHFGGAASHCGDGRAGESRIGATSGVTGAPRARSSR